MVLKFNKISHCCFIHCVLDFSKGKTGVGGTSHHQTIVSSMFHHKLGIAVKFGTSVCLYSVECWGQELRMEQRQVLLGGRFSPQILECTSICTFLVCFPDML